MKILEFINRNSLRPVGGPTGYVYTLMKEDKEGKLDFLDSPFDLNVQQKNSDFKNRLFKNLSLTKMLIVGKRDQIIENNEYDIIHFHSTFALYNNRKSLKKYTGRIILTSHSPQILSKEYYEDAKKWERILFGFMYKFLIRMDEGAFNIANKIIFPCPEAEEPYYHTWNKYEKFKSNNVSKYEYLLSGTDQRIAKESRETILARYNIPTNAFVITYVGRHNIVKGYKRLCEFGQRYRNSKDVWFLVAGKEEPLTHPKLNNWVEVGWTNDPNSIIGSADVFVLPNTETYFDLVLLEVLSLGKIAVISCTGGNRFFDSEKYPGVFVFRTDDDLERILNNIRKMTIAERKKLGLSNRELYDSTFSSRVFYNNYINLINRIGMDE